MTNMPDIGEISRKVDELLARMTLEEKIAQLGSYWIYDLQTKGVFDVTKLAARLQFGIGQISRIGGAAAYPPGESAKVYNHIQHYLREQTRLGIPAINHEECCSGLMVPGASIFPQMIGLASTFEPELARQMTNAIRRQMLAVGARQGLAPVLDVARDPRWGRVEETFGEDPLLVSQFGMEYIRGLQTDDLRNGVLATGKHFVGHSYSLGGMNCAPVLLGWHELWETYLSSFQAAIRDAGLASMMNAYPELDGEVVAASKKVLTDLLRDKLGFDGLVVSDYEAVSMLHNYHFIAKSRKEAAIKALTAGIDVEMPRVSCYGEDLHEAVNSGELPIDVIDRSVRRHLQKKFELGLFENPYVNEDEVIQVFDTPQDRDLAYSIACKSMVLLKNDGVLPLKPDLKVAVIGPNADTSRCLMGDYSYAAVTELMKITVDENSVFGAMTADDLKNLTVPVLTFLDVIKHKIPTSQLRYAKGCDVMSADESGFSEAVEAAKTSDIAILVMGGLSGLAPYCSTGEFRDTTNLGLPGVQEKLVKAVASVGKPVILVLIDGRPTAIPDLVEQSNAILEAWVPGEEGARAIVSVLFGDVNPGGKLPISVPRSAGALPVYYNHKPSGMHSNIYGDYVNEPARPLFAFGHGLSYTSFEYSHLEIKPRIITAGETVDVSVILKNTGVRTGEEVVQLYLRDIYASLPRQVKELKGFARVELKPGESRTIVFHLPVNLLAFYDSDLRLILEPGEFQVMVGSSSDDIRMTGEFSLTGDVEHIQDRVFICPVEIL